MKLFEMYEPKERSIQHVLEHVDFLRASGKDLQDAINITASKYYLDSSLLAKHYRRKVP